MLAGPLRSLAQGFLHLLYPRVCWACGQSLPPGRDDFCENCRALLTNDPQPRCPRCAASVGPYINLDGGCTGCRGVTLGFEGALCLGSHEGLLRDLILRLKHHSGEGLAEVLARLWASHTAPALRATGAQLVVPVPLHWWRRLARGYNQSEALARTLAAHLEIPCRPRCLRRVRATRMQRHDMSPTARKENVHQAFRARPSANLQGKTVLLVDDVMTSGSTVNEVARVLKTAGARQVVVALLARASGPHPGRL
jgi:ComF family protein